MAQIELLYGRHAVLEALRAGRRPIRRVLLGQGVRQQADIIAEIVAAARERGCPVSEAPRQAFDLAGDVNHQGVLAEAGPYRCVDLDEVLTAPGEPFCLALDHLQDVQNLGTLLRTAEAMAVTGIILPDRRAAGITPAVVNASSGAVEHLNIALVTNLVQALVRLKKSGVWIVGLDAAPSAVPLPRADLSGPLVLVVGAEGAGLSRLTRETCDWLLAIPMCGEIASLNAAVAGSIALFAARQARGWPPVDRPLGFGRAGH
ncbi:MAG: 23S rRNA (guanosine(2251)-2'-O)-methyltransferase RlmB [Anaerolineae bacterium]|jgi:23S rRNA (guanosine2251-2'-O)-methyltransferase|nr:23S rRNA (guanosine(2251)-2'-O)-methyltransferase RlmB [Anaerolineae bacterium]